MPCTSIKTDLSTISKSFHERLGVILETASATLTATETVQRGVELISVSTKDLKGKVGKVSDAADKIADTTATYRDAVLKNQTQGNRTEVVLTPNPRPQG